MLCGPYESYNPEVTEAIWPVNYVDEFIIPTDNGPCPLAMCTPMLGRIIKDKHMINQYKTVNEMDIN